VCLAPSIIKFEEYQIKFAGNRISQKYTPRYLQGIQHIVNCRRHKCLPPHLVKSMALIREIVQQAIKTGYLSDTAVEQLHQLLKTEYEEEDVDALMRLHQATVTGRVQQKLRDEKKLTPATTKRNIVKMKLVYQTTVGVLVLATIVFATPKNLEKKVISANDNITTSLNAGEI
jgi:hypothetical protein